MNKTPLNKKQPQPSAHASNPSPQKLSARERIAQLVDPGSFQEVGALVSAFDAAQTGQKKYGDGVITGYATVDGRRVALYSQDFSLQGGSVGKHHAKKICQIMDMAAQTGCPIIGIIDSGGARITEGIHALAGFGEIFARNVRYSGIVPQLSVILGPCAGGAVYSPALTDMIFTTRSISQLFITGPQVIAQVTGEVINKQDLGGADVHASKSGVVHVVSDSEADCFISVRQALSYLPDNCKTPSDVVPAQPPLATIDTVVPHNHSTSYDIRSLISAIFDEESFFEIHAAFAQNICVGFARLDGRSIGIVANQPLCKAGTIDIDASCKAARFINLCNTFGIPLISLVDTPGYLPGVEQEHNGIIRHGAKLLHAYASAQVPLITVIVRKSFGGAYIVMGSKHLGADLVFAWKHAQIAVLGAPSAVAIIHRKTLKNAPPESRDALQKNLTDQYTSDFLHPYTAAEYGYIDGIIEPEETREKLIAALDITQSKRSLNKLPHAHGNHPL